MFPRSLYSWTKSWCSPKTKTKTRFLNVKRNFLATRPTERSASRCAHSPEISSFSLRIHIHTHIYNIYIYKRVVCTKQTKRSSFRLELFGPRTVKRCCGSWIDPSVSPIRQIQSCAAKRLVILRRAESQVEGESLWWGRGARARKMAREDRSGNDLILSCGPWEGGHAVLPHSEKGKRAFAGRLVQAGMKKAAHRSLRRRETEAIDVIRGLSALGSFDRSAECRFSSNKRQRHRRRVTLATEKDTRPCPLYFARTSYVENIWTIGLPAT